MKVYINNQGHMTKMAAMIAKTFKNLLLQNQKAYDFKLGMKHQAMGSSTKFI